MNRARDWLRQGFRDLEQARESAKAGFHEWACFASQQAAEKGIKAVYLHLGAEAWGHSLSRLCLGLREKIEIPEYVADAARILDHFYIPTRYPNGFDEGMPGDYYAEEDSARAIKCAEEILRLCEGFLAGP